MYPVAGKLANYASEWYVQKVENNSQNPARQPDR